jgi:hypothetical protein
MWAAGSAEHMVIFKSLTYFIQTVVSVYTVITLTFKFFIALNQLLGPVKEKY